MAKKQPASAPGPQTIGQRIRALRVRAGLTVTAAALAAGMSRTYWTSLESDRRVPNWDTVARVAEALGASLGDFGPDSTD